LETEMLLRIKHQLGPEKIRRFLDKVCHKDGSPTPAQEIIHNMEDFVRVLYASAYAEGRANRFPYRVIWGDGLVKTGRFEFREHRFVPSSYRIDASGAKRQKKPVKTGDQKNAFDKDAEPAEYQQDLLFTVVQEDPEETKPITKGRPWKTD
ncbi:MAG: DUF5716 family protein, partial [Spirochaetales bacterium]|nr:DUF5716 family protein [Spirochaetales bacterium]